MLVARFFSFSFNVSPTRLWTWYAILAIFNLSSANTFSSVKAKCRFLEVFEERLRQDQPALTCRQILSQLSAAPLTSASPGSSAVAESLVLSPAQASFFPPKIYICSCDNIHSYLAIDHCLEGGLVGK